MELRPQHPKRTSLHHINWQFPVIQRQWGAIPDCNGFAVVSAVGNIFQYVTSWNSSVPSVHLWILVQYGFRSHFSAVSHRAFKGPFLFSFSCPLPFLDLLFMSVRCVSLVHVSQFCFMGDQSYDKTMLEMACKSVVINIYMTWLETRELSVCVHLCKVPNNCSNLLSVELARSSGVNQMFFFTGSSTRNVRQGKRCFF